MSQSSYVMPTTGLVTMTAFAADLNGGFNAFASRHSGTTAPVNGPGGAPTQFQDWADTTAPTLVIYKTFDGTNWVTVGTLDTANSVWTPGNARFELSATRTYYVRKDGNDSNSGTADNAGGAFLTIQKAINTVVALDLSTFQDVTVQVRAGTYTENLFVQDAVPAVPSLGPILVGDTTTPGNVILDGAHTIRASSWRFRGMKFISSAGTCLDVGRGSFLVIDGNVEFGASSDGHFSATQKSVLFISTSYSISGSAAFHWSCQSGALIRVRAVTITLTGTPNFSDFFLSQQSGGMYQADSVTFTGAATGKRFNLDGPGGVYTRTNGNLNYLPGDSAGTFTSGAFYDQLNTPAALPSVTVTAATYTVLTSDFSIIANLAGTVTLTLPSATPGGRLLTVKTIQNQTVVSASANVVPLAGGAAGTAILSGTAGRWARLQANGTNWEIIEGVT